MYRSISYYVMSPHHSTHPTHPSSKLKYVRTDDGRSGAVRTRRGVRIQHPTHTQLSFSLRCAARKNNLFGLRAMSDAKRTYSVLVDRQRGVRIFLLSGYFLNCAHQTHHRVVWGGEDCGRMLLSARIERKYHEYSASTTWHKLPE